MSVRHGSFAGNTARPPRSPLPSPRAVKVTEAPVIEAVTAVARKLPSSVHRTLACPFASVVLVVELREPFPAAAAHVTVVPLTGAPVELLTVTTSGAASCDDKVPCCASPLVFARRSPCTPVLPVVSLPGVVGAAAEHAINATNSRIAREVRTSRIERLRWKNSFQSPREHSDFPDDDAHARSATGTARAFNVCAMT